MRCKGRCFLGIVQAFSKKKYIFAPKYVVMQNKKMTLVSPCRVQLPKNVDERGVLSFLEGGSDIPFEVARVFWITDVPAGKTRGGHAHWTCHEAVFAVQGRFEIEVDDGRQREVFVLDAPNEGVVVPAGAWCELRHFEPGTVCVVMASEHFDANGYVHDKGEWSKVKG